MAKGSILDAADAVGREQDVVAASIRYREKLEKAWLLKRAALEKQIAEATGDQKKKLEEKAEKDRLKHEKQTAKYVADYTAALETENRQRAFKEQKEAQEELAKSYAERLSASITQKTGGVLNGEKLVANVTKGVKALGGSVEKYLSTYSQYMSSVEARLQGLGKNFNYETLNRTIRNNTALNPYVRYTAVLEKVAGLVDQGIASNLTQRAFLATISDKIATTFDAANASLLSIVRIQQQDSTAARLGMEAELTRLFNYYFSDTSYLSDSFDSVQSALIDVSAALGAQASVEFEYMVQKWLGALGSVGVNSSTLQSIAQGLNYLGSGDVESLSSNSALQNLFVMAANRSGLNYSKMLSGGMNAAEANSLLGGIVDYIQEISSGSNNVVKKQYAQLFGLTMSDMVAFNNISKSTMESLYDSAMSYKDTLNELNDQLSQVGSRMHLSEKLDNIFDNILAATGMGVANTAPLYAVWKSADLLESITGGINLPFISAFGNGFDLNMSIEGLTKGTVVGISALASLISGIGALAVSGGDMLNLSSWATNPDKSGGFTGYQSANTLSTKKSTTNYISSGDSLGIQQSVSDKQLETGKQVSGEQESSGDEMMTILRFIKSYFEDGGLSDSPLKVEISRVDSSVGSINAGNPFYTYTTGGLG